MPGEPPGARGLPFIGELLPFARDGFAFVEERAARHGPVFRTSLFGDDMVVLVGPEAAAAFVDEANVQRGGAFPPHIEALFGKGAVNQLDDGAHRARKAHVMAALSGEALVDYLPTIRAVTRAAVTDWIGRGEVRLLDEAKRLSLQIISQTIRGERLTDAELRVLADDIRAVGAAFSAPPFDLPGTRLNRALKARDRLYALYRGDVAKRRASPGQDGLSRMLASRVDARGLTDDEAVLEMHHIVLAGFIVWSFATWGVHQLALQPTWTTRVRDALADLPEDPGARALAEVPELTWLVKEIKRTDPVLPFVPGRARRDFEVGGYTLSAGTPLLWALHASHNFDAAASYDDARRFDPARFSPERAEDARHPEAFSPQGAGSVRGGHKCGGVELSTLLTQVFFFELLRRATIALPEQDLRMDVSASPAEQRDGLRVRLSPLGDGA